MSDFRHAKDARQAPHSRCRIFDIAPAHGQIPLSKNDAEARRAEHGRSLAQNARRIAPLRFRLYSESPGGGRPDDSRLRPAAPGRRCRASVTTFTSSVTAVPSATTGERICSAPAWRAPGGRHRCRAGARWKPLSWLSGPRRERGGGAGADHDQHQRPYLLRAGGDCRPP